jgi:hypothetical protein
VTSVPQLVDPYAGVPPPDEPADRKSAPRTTIADRLLSRADLNDLPTPSPLIDRTLDMRAVSVLAGYWGTCKSFIALDWSACIATGKPWQTRHVQQGSVLYVAAEGAYGLGQRLDAWEYAWHDKIDADTFAVYPQPVNLLDRGAVAELAAASAGRHLIVIDTLARCMPGGDENSARDMGVAVNALYELQRATANGSVLGLHHTGKDKTTIRGSSALEAGVDTIYATEGGPESLTLNRAKRKDGPLYDRVNLKLDTVLNSAVIVSANRTDMTGTEDKLMSAFMSAFSATGATKSELRAVADMPPASFDRGLNRLVSRGLLANSGSDARPFYKHTETS